MRMTLPFLDSWTDPATMVTSGKVRAQDRPAWKTSAGITITSLGCDATYPANERQGTGRAWTALESSGRASLYLGAAARSWEAGGVSEAAVRIEPLTMADVASAVELAVRVLGVKPGDRGEQFAADITGEQRQMFVARANGQIVAYGRVLELATGEAGPGTPAGCYLSGVLVEPAWRGRGIATALTRARLHWAFARTGTVFYMTGADNAASLHLHAALGFQEIKRFESERSATGVGVLSQLMRTAADRDQLGRTSHHSTAVKVEPAD